VIRSNGPDKSFHDHGQSESEFAEVIKCLTEEDAMVLDPFVGGGSVAAAALTLGRKFIGIDIDRKHIEITRRRVEEVAKGLETI
jgi:DNA modification methylase